MRKLVAKHEDLIYDVGMHQGEDSEFYLKKGFRVIGFEANPELIDFCKAKFSAEIKNKKLVVVEGAITDNLKLNKVKFYKNVNRTIWGTINRDWAKKNEKLGTTHEQMDVDAVDFSECIEKFGIPHYMKIDIEGADMICLKQLLNFKPRPDYLSMESSKISIKEIRKEINLIEKLGYYEFKAIQQKNVQNQIIPDPPKEGAHVEHKFSAGSSGLFGNELPGKWKSKKGILRKYRLIMLKYRLFGEEGFFRKNVIGKKIIRLMQRITKSSIPGWYDTHAKYSQADNQRSPS